MNIEQVKLIYAIVVLITGFTGVSLPWLIPAMQYGGRILALGDTFAAGVLGGAGLVHLLDGGIEGFRLSAPGLHYPLALVISGLSFLFMLLVEGVIFGEFHSIHSENRHIVIIHEITPARSTDFPYVQTFILLVVLSMHSLILGLTLGVQQTKKRMAIVFTAIIAHKLFAGFALGVSYRRGGFSWSKIFPSIIFFAAMVPAGILMGTIASTIFTYNSGIWFESTFNSIGAGTFLYIASVDIISNEFHEPVAGDRILKWLLTVAGFGLMALLAVWV